ncbi:hypothetical protein BLNAU_6844 [Blattamonas nauphoetae]|uniref:Uncharacterized protein n=1 Tax=Blattamonas nauphoetae TaxID=2049346 RepID=A0ABQ9Y329_9EUKA|nr:hypothetical protein BLNAU_6844 [Blattamonas nauphoetae]
MRSRKTWSDRILSSSSDRLEGKELFQGCKYITLTLCDQSDQDRFFFKSCGGAPTLARQVIQGSESHQSMGHHSNQTCAPNVSRDIILGYSARKTRCSLQQCSSTLLRCPFAAGQSCREITNNQSTSERRTITREFVAPGDDQQGFTVKNQQGEVGFLFHNNSCLYTSLGCYSKRSFLVKRGNDFPSTANNR